MIRIKTRRGSPACRAAERRQAVAADFPFTIKDIAYLLDLRIRHKNAVCLDVNCPFCGETKGKMNLNLKKNVFKCNRCGETGGMLALYGKVYQVDNQTAYKEIMEALGENRQIPAYQRKPKAEEVKETEIINAPVASVNVKDKTYTMLFSMLCLSDTHRKNLLQRGFSEEQMEENGYRSTPPFGYRKLTKRLLEAGCTVEGVPGFFQDADGEWTMHFHPRSSGFMIPVRNLEGQITAVQIRLDRPYEGRKYMWLSSINNHMGASSGSPVHLAGRQGDKIVFVTEGPLKGDIAHALSGRTFACVAGVNQYANLPAFLEEMKGLGTEYIYEAYDMDKMLKTKCRGDYDEKCVQCPNYHRKWDKVNIPCDKKKGKRENIQRGCRKLSDICHELNLPGRTLTWNLDREGDWAGSLKGVDDYLLDLRNRGI